jgi:hypothetical protein
MRALIDATKQLPYLDAFEPVTINPSTYIELSVSASVISGMVILILMFWAFLAFNRLWQRSLSEDAAAAIAHAQARGLRLLPPGITPRRAVEGHIGSMFVRIEWRGGAFGTWSRVYLGDRVRDLPLLSGAAEVERLLQPEPT